MRAGDHAQAIPALEVAVGMPARGEELLALRDKAHLSLGYAYASTEDYEQARKQLEAVRPDGPFSNRALLALGWIAHKQGRSESALVSWMELRGRSPTDPAVLETLLVVPAVYRELDALQTATQDYEAAMATYSSELNHLANARESVQKGNTVSLLLQKDSRTGQEAAAQSGPGETRYLGPLLASRDFQEMLQGHGELQSMLDNVDEGLRNIDVLAKAAAPAGTGACRFRYRVVSGTCCPGVCRVHNREPPDTPAAAGRMQARPAIRNGSSNGKTGTGNQQTLRQPRFRCCRRLIYLMIGHWNPCRIPNSQDCRIPTFPVCPRNPNSSGICRARK